MHFSWKKFSSETYQEIRHIAVYVKNAYLGKAFSKVALSSSFGSFIHLFPRGSYNPFSTVSITNKRTAVNYLFYYFECIWCFSIFVTQLITCKHSQPLPFAPIRFKKRFSYNSTSVSTNSHLCVCDCIESMIYDMRECAFLETCDVWFWRRFCIILMSINFSSICNLDHGNENLKKQEQVSFRPLFCLTAETRHSRILRYLFRFYLFAAYSQKRKLRHWLFNILDFQTSYPPACSLNHSSLVRLRKKLRRTTTYR